MSDILQMVEVVARQAGAILMEGYGNVRHIQQKGAIDLVTEFDKRSEEIIISVIEKEFPDHAILAEESGQNKTISESLTPWMGQQTLLMEYQFFLFQWGYCETTLRWWESFTIRFGTRCFQRNQNMALL
jgi:myo-inositol-1(or 4)-monophosphatase